MSGIKKQGCFLVWQKRKIQVHSSAKKSDLVATMSKGLQEQRRCIKYSSADLNTLPMDKEIKTPLVLIAAASDLLMVSDSHSHSIYQVCINNNRAFLKGTVSLLMKLPEGAQPMGRV